MRRECVQGFLDMGCTRMLCALHLQYVQLFVCISYYNDQLKKKKKQQQQEEEEGWDGHRAFIKQKPEIFITLQPSHCQRLRKCPSPYPNKRRMITQLLHPSETFPVSSHELYYFKGRKKSSLVIYHLLCYSRFFTTNNSALCLVEANCTDKWVANRKFRR